MKISDLFRFSADNLSRRVGRTILTVIGVVVGVCAIVVMVSLGIAVNRATDEMLKNWGDLRKISVFRFSAQQGTADLDDSMVTYFKSLPHVVAATPKYSPTFTGIVAADKGDRYVVDWSMVSGMEPDALPEMGYELITGEYFTEKNYGTGRIPVLVGSQFIFDFVDTRKGENNPDRQRTQQYPEYDDEAEYYDDRPTNMPQYDENGTLLNPEEFFFDIMNTKLTYRMEYGYDETTEQQKYKNYELVVVGMIDSTSEYDIYDGIVFRLEDIQKMEREHKQLQGSGSQGSANMNSFGFGDDGTTQVAGYDEVYVKVDDVNNMPEVEKAIKAIGYRIDSMSETRQQMQGQVAQTQLMLGGLAAVSLFVAALNIMNTMTMAIYERTREIGVMKVLGCKLSNIRSMFLIESGAIGLIGGLFGLALSFLISAALNYLPGLLAEWGLDSAIDIASMFGLAELSSTMPDMQLSTIPLWLALLALGFAAGVGLLSGIAPANRAVKISSLEAIRHE